MQPLRAEGSTPVRTSPKVTRAAILDPAMLARIIPGAECVERAADGSFVATLGLGVGPFRGRQTVTLHVRDETTHSLAVAGRATGPFGSGEAIGHIELHSQGEGTVIAWRYDGGVRGPVTLAGATLLRLSATAFIARVFASLRRQLDARKRADLAARPLAPPTEDLGRRS